MNKRDREKETNEATKLYKMWATRKSNKNRFSIELNSHITIGLESIECLTSFVLLEVLFSSRLLGRDGLYFLFIDKLLFPFFNWRRWKTENYNKTEMICLMNWKFFGVSLPTMPFHLISFFNEYWTLPLTKCLHNFLFSLRRNFFSYSSLHYTNWYESKWNRFAFHFILNEFFDSRCCDTLNTFSYFISVPL